MVASSAQTSPVNLVSLIEKFGSEEKCRAYLEELRWPDGPVCPRCEKDTTVSKLYDRDQFECDSCRYQFSVTSGTVMHDTKLPLWKWFLAVYMIVEAKKGVSANQLKRTLGVSYRTAWFLCHRIRFALTTPDALLKGVVEIDETVVGGRAKRGRDVMENKTWVVGAVARDGGIRLRKVAKRDGVTLRKFIEDAVGTDAERIITDDYRGYDWTGVKHMGIPRGRVNHSREEWRVGDDHTNSIEGAWGLFKRSIIGSYHKISLKHLDRYLEEFEFRFNNRDNPFIFRDAMSLLIQPGRLEYQDLVAS